jgi:sporulation protein YlmC with PRC-barrel domain
MADHQFNVKLSELLKRQVIDSEDIKVGTVEDVWLDADGSIWLVVGGNLIQDTLAKLKIRPDIELLVPTEAIAATSGGVISLKWSRLELEATCDDCWTREKERLVYAATTEPDRQPGLRLISPHVGA